MLDPDHAPLCLAREAMGTRFEFVLAGLDEPDLHAAAEDAFAEIHALHDRLNWFAPGSVVSALAAAAGQEPLRIAPDLFDLLTLCRDIWARSGGTFDPTVAPLLLAWGLRGPAAPPPSPDALAAARALVGMDKLRLDPEHHTAFLTLRGMSLDLGAVAKGWALDHAAAILQEAGVPAALLHAGTSSITAWGAPPGREGWDVRIAAPPTFTLPGLPDLTVTLRDTSLSISAPHGRVSAAGDGHVLDPRTARPVPGATLAACLGDSGAACDAWSTACLVAAARPPACPASITAAIAGAAWRIDGPLHAAITAHAPPRRGQDFGPGRC